MTRVTEEDIAICVARIADGREDGICTYNRARTEIPNLIQLHPADLAQSHTRRREPMWHQLIRNIRSHHGEDGNFIARGLLEHVSRRGYRITPAGKSFLKQQRF